ncbi:MAG: NAD(+)--dinitrogen-reductase ADP-D-ribosyltransferase [Proteobacteria bacterium]|nr:NAD(+)--dinitrogen-reductase ADP-D-ribosyltransferase [Pseudomonadota bacterium]
MKEIINTDQADLAYSGHNNPSDFVGVATTLPRNAHLIINRCNLPAVILGSLTYQQHPVPLLLDGVAQFHRGLFELLDRLGDAPERAQAFMQHMNAAFSLNCLEEAGYSVSTTRNRAKSNYLKMVRGWSFDSGSREAAVLKGWVESRFGLLQRHHVNPIRDFSDDTYRNYLEMRSSGLYGTNALESQLDLLYTYCQYELARQHPGQSHFTLYRGVNRVDEHETVAERDDKRRVVLLNSLSSFTANRERADEFGDYLLTARVPLSKIFYYTRLLPDMLKGEEEYVVIGGLYEVGIAAY